MPGQGPSLTRSDVSSVDDPTGMRARMGNIEARVDRFETRVEREFANGSQSFARREVMDRMEREFHSDVNDIRRDLAALAADVKQIHDSQLQQYRAIRNGIIIAISAAMASGMISLVVWVVTRPNG